MSDSLYVYAVVRARAVPPDTHGIDGRPLRAVAAGDVAAVVHDHEGQPYGGSDDDVRRRALEHNAVVERLWQADRAVLPMSFDVIVASSEVEPAEQRLRRWLEGASAAVASRLQAVDGHAELRVDIGLDPATAAADDAEVADLRRQAAASSPGVERLLRKRVVRREHDVAERLADDVYADARERLARVSDDIVENPRGAPEPGEVLVLSASLLVAEEGVRAVGAELTAVRAKHPAARIRFYGPWPPYSFADLGDEGGPGQGPPPEG